MKIVAISTQSEDARNLIQLAQNVGYITFVYDHVDPNQDLGLNNFFYVGSDKELSEKIDLINSSIAVAEEVIRL